MHHLRGFVAGQLPNGAFVAFRDPIYDGACSISEACARRTTPRHATLLLVSYVPISVSVRARGLRRKSRKAGFAAG